MAGKLKLGSGITRLEARRRGVAESGGIRQQHGRARRRRRKKRGPTGGAHMVAQT
jgi:hypothetical protein